ncbi:MAG: hypothetical protein Q4C40_05520 [Eubacteriales bacterium]|nr:hypothetical protein [Eubacteriales bacterium]
MVENTGYGAENRTVLDKRAEAEKRKRARLRARIRKKRLRLLALGAMCIVAAVLAVSTVTCYVQMTDLKSQVEEKQQTLAQLESEYVSLNAKKENSIDLSQVEDYAENVLGLVKLDRSQEEYLELQKTDQVEVNEASSGVEKLASSFVKSFNAILSFLR